MRAKLVMIGLAALMVGNPGRTADPAGPTPDQLVRMSRCELESLYRSADIGPEPGGFAPARAIFDPGSRKTVPMSWATHVLWKGKEFPGNATMINHLAFGLKAVKARVFLGESWLDGRPAWVFDYCGTSRLFGNVRDEVREVSPGVYLGLTYLRRADGPKLAVFFALDARCAAVK